MRHGGGKLLVSFPIERLEECADAFDNHLEGVVFIALSLRPRRKERFPRFIVKDVIEIAAGQRWSN